MPPAVRFERRGLGEARLAVVQQIAHAFVTVGADTGAFVGEYATPMHWKGLLQDVRLYRGVVSREANRDLLAEWANRPDCGCRK